MTSSLGTFGRYHLIEKLAEGGMGYVYLAALRSETGFEKRVALKRVLKEIGQDEEFLGRFFDEAQIASTLSHGNIVQVFDFGEIEGEYFLAMEYVDGPDLQTLLDVARRTRQPIPIPTALYIASELCKGLGAAHQCRDSEGRPTPITHRDISPQNVLLSRSGDVKVTDFGIAKTAEKHMKTKTGMLIGKVRYMSPEQASAQPVDVRTDVFAAGCVLFEMISGRTLFDGQSPEEIIIKVMESPIPKLSDITPLAPQALDPILEKALNRDKDNRYQNGALFGRDLEQLLHSIAPIFSNENLASYVSALCPKISKQSARTTKPLKSAEKADRQTKIKPEEPISKHNELGYAETQLPEHNSQALNQQSHPELEKIKRRTMILSDQNAPIENPKKVDLPSGPYATAVQMRAKQRAQGQESIPSPQQVAPIPPASNSQNALQISETHKSPSPNPNISSDPEPTPLVEDQKQSRSKSEKRATTRTPWRSFLFIGIAILGICGGVLWGLRANKNEMLNLSSALPLTKGIDLGGATLLQYETINQTKLKLTLTNSDTFPLNSLSLFAEKKRRHAKFWYSKKNKTIVVFDYPSPKKNKKTYLVVDNNEKTKIYSIN